MARTSDVIAGAEWIYNNRERYNIRVVNMSLHSTTPSNFTKDPLDRAVEKLWFGGVVVVVASGNYGKPDGPSGVPFAPGNDPFVITVGAVDLEGSTNARKHDIASWSAYGYTNDGFRKPEIAAAGRYMIGPVPLTPRCTLERPEHVVSPDLHAALGHVVRGSDRGRRSCPDPRPASVLDAGSGQGCADAEGTVHPRGSLTGRPASARSTPHGRLTSPGPVTRTWRSTGSSSPTRPASRRPCSTRRAGLTWPGRNVPGTQRPGRTSPGATLPGRPCPGGMSPGATSPGRTSPGATCSPPRTRLGGRGRRRSRVPERRLRDDARGRGGGCCRSGPRHPGPAGVTRTTTTPLNPDHVTRGRAIRPAPAVTRTGDAEPRARLPTLRRGSHFLRPPERDKETPTMRYERIP